MNLSVLHLEIKRSLVKGFYDIKEGWFCDKEECDIFQILTVKLLKIELVIINLKDNKQRNLKMNK